MVDTFHWDFKDMGDIHCIVFRFQGHEELCNKRIKLTYTEHHNQNTSLNGLLRSLTEGHR